MGEFVLKDGRDVRIFPLLMPEGWKSQFRKFGDGGLTRFVKGIVFASVQTIFEQLKIR